MGVDGTWWLIEEEAPFDPAFTPQFELRDGKVFDGRTGQLEGAYEYADGALRITIKNDFGAVRYTIEGTVPAESAYDLEVNIYYPAITNDSGEDDAGEDLVMYGLMRRTSASVTPIRP